MEQGGCKYIEPFGARQGPEFHVTGVGVGEPMPPCIVNRPAGTRSWLLMHFRNPVLLEVEGQAEWHPEDSLMIWTERDGHYYGNPDIPWSHSWTHCVGQAVGAMVSDAGLPIRKPFVFKRRDAMDRLLSQMYQEATSRKEPDETIMRDFLEILLREIARALRKPGKGASMPGRIIAARRHIESHLSERLSLRKLALLSRLSVPHFCAEFKRHVGRAPIDYLLESRMLQAAYLLRDVNLSVAEVAARVGYSDPFQFSKMFKRRTGSSPREARKSLSKRPDKD